ncbi:MAG: hypothetical protein K6U14_06745 [Firmicutes bacterium]|nr:hypothetical protein [Alicyclobacillaceae bacterium]MCL6497319.1 hypothetical protein [Bacillota bacterium]
MQITPTILVNTFVNNVNTIQQQLVQLEEESSSGTKYQYPQDNPGAIAVTMDLNSVSGLITNYQNATAQAQDWLNAQASALQQLTTLWNDVYSKAVEAQNGSMSPADRQAVIDQLTADQTTLSQILTTTFQGQPLFDFNPAAPLGPNPANQPMVFEIGPGASVTVNAIDPSVNQVNPAVPLDQQLQQDLTNLINTLSSPSFSPTSVNLTVLQQDLTSISSAQAVVGGRLARVNQENQYLTQLNQTLTATESSIDGANMAQVASQLNLEEQAYQAALQTGAQVLSISLLNYLHP